MKWWDRMPWSSFLECWVWSQLFHSPLLPIKRLFSSSLLSAIRGVSSAYLRLLIFLLEILIPACASSSLAFHMMYSTYKLNKQSDIIQPWHTPFPVHCSMSGSNCCFLTCIHISQVTDKLVWYSKKFPQFVVIHTVKGFSIVNEAEVDIFLEFPCFSYDPMDVGNLISGSSACSKSSRKFSVHILLKPTLKDFEHYLASMWYECNCGIVWTFFGIALLWNWSENVRVEVKNVEIIMG